MATLKTHETTVGVTGFLAGATEDLHLAGRKTGVALPQCLTPPAQKTGGEAVASARDFPPYRVGENRGWHRTGVSPCKQALTRAASPCLDSGSAQPIRRELQKPGKSCLVGLHLSKVDLPTSKNATVSSVETMGTNFKWRASHGRC